MLWEFAYIQTKQHKNPVAIVRFIIAATRKMLILQQIFYTFTSHAHISSSGSLVEDFLEIAIRPDHNVTETSNGWPDHC